MATNAGMQNSQQRVSVANDLAATERPNLDSSTATSTPPHLLWPCISSDIEEITRKTGSYKTFPMFFRMLQSAMSGSASLHLDVLTREDLVRPALCHGLSLAPFTQIGMRRQLLLAATAAHLLHPFLAQPPQELLRAQRTGMAVGSAMGRHTTSGSASKRYLIMSYAAEWDRVHYPLPLSAQDPPKLVSLQRTIRRLRAEVSHWQAMAAQGEGDAGQGGATLARLHHDHARLEQAAESQAAQLSAAQQKVRELSTAATTADTRRAKAEESLHKLRSTSRAEMASLQQEVDALKAHIGELHASGSVASARADHRASAELVEVQAANERLRGRLRELTRQMAAAGLRPKPSGSSGRASAGRASGTRPGAVRREPATRTSRRPTTPGSVRSCSSVSSASTAHSAAVRQPRRQYARPWATSSTGSRQSSSARRRSPATTPRGRPRAASRGSAASSCGGYSSDGGCSARSRSSAASRRSAQSTGSARSNASSISRRLSRRSGSKYGYDPVEYALERRRQIEAARAKRQGAGRGPSPYAAERSGGRGPSPVRPAAATASPARSSGSRASRSQRARSSGSTRQRSKQHSKPAAQASPGWAASPAPAPQPPAAPQQPQHVPPPATSDMSDIDARLKALQSFLKAAKAGQPAPSHL